MNGKPFNMKKLIVVFTLFSALFAQAQKAGNKLTFTKGQTLEVVSNMNVFAESMMGPSSGTVTITDTYTINDASADAFTLVKAPKQIKLDFAFGSQKIKIDTDNPEDMKGMFAQPMKEVMNQKPEFTIDAAGKIIAVKQAEKKKSEEPGAAGMMGMMLPGMDLAGSLPQVGNPSFFQVLPNREVGIGDTWTDSLNLDGNRNVTVYKVKEITDKDIVLDFTGEGQTKTRREAMGMSVDVNATHRTSGSIVIDKATGIMKQKTATNHTETAMNLGGNEMTSNVKTTVVTNVSNSK